MPRATFRIAKRFKFSAMHSLPGLPSSHKCHREHGHNYVVEVELHARLLDAQGMVWDYGELAKFRDWLDITLDHRNLNDYMQRFDEYRQSTAENLAFRLFQVVRELQPPLRARLSAVRVKETDDTWAEYRPS